jgi:CRISPR/Cas system-associated exonuclease Cas4 (RecB family)
METMRTIRASEIGTYLFCKRAWWYRNQGVESENQQEMASGSAFHKQHGRQVIYASLLRIGGWMLLLLAVVLIAVGLALQLIH